MTKQYDRDLRSNQKQCYNFVHRYNAPMNRTTQSTRITFLGDALCGGALLAAHETAAGYDSRHVFAPVRDLLSESNTT
jgi:hypothetical protein